MCGTNRIASKNRENEYFTNKIVHFSSLSTKDFKVKMLSLNVFKVYEMNCIVRRKMMQLYHTPNKAHKLRKRIVLNK